MAANDTLEQFSLRWNNFHTNLTHGFHDLLEGADLVDVTLAAEDGHFVQAHKIVLSVCSPYFRQLFKVNPCKHPIVILKDVGHHDLKDILEFMYLGQVNVFRDNLTAFLKTAELLQVKGLTGDDDGDSSDDKKKKDDDDEILDNNCSAIQQQQPEFGIYDAERKSSSPPPPPKHKSKNDVVKRRRKSNYLMERNIDNKQDMQELIDIETDPKHEPFEYNNIMSENSAFFLPIDSNNGTDTSAAAAAAATTTSFLLYDDAFCPVCNKKFVNRYNLKVHIRDKHEANDSIIECRICGKGMRNQSCLRVHMYHHRKQQLLLLTAKQTDFTTR